MAQLLFSDVCKLLDVLYDQALEGKSKESQSTIWRWFSHHRHLLDPLDAPAGAALISTLLPAKRTDRVYHLQDSRLEKIFERAQRLGDSRLRDLRRYKVPGSGLDLADCIYAILSATPNPDQAPASVLEVDNLLRAAAAKIRFTSKNAHEADYPHAEPDGNGLEKLYMRLSPLEAKWLTRLVLKDFRVIDVDESVIYRAYHGLLPRILRVRDNIPAAANVLRDILREEREDQARRGQGPGKPARWDTEVVLRHLRPTLGTKVGRPFWRKARSIKHCLDMGHGFMSVEKKIDGEYCQIHVDLSKGRDCIQIFSKSGKDSTKDRIRVHEAIREALDLGKPGCRITKGCILEGELVAYCDHKCKILPFHKVRNHVTRSGRYIGSEMDSPPRSTEHLMVIYYDAFLIDDESLLGVRHSRRMEMLKDILTLRPGYAELVERRVLDFNKPQAASDLRSMFANCITSCEEGLVIKADEPMMVFNELREDFTGCPIKFKKEYIGTFGDLGDLAAVAVRYDSRRAKVLRIPNLKWTHFYLGCLTNKSSLHLPGTVPEFTVVVVVEPDAAFLSTVVAHCQPGAVSPAENTSLKLVIPEGVSGGRKPTFVLTRPPIFDVRCFAFEKPGNVGFYTPRFTTASKVHFDRGIGDVMTFDELQRVGQRAMAERPWEDGESQEFLKWVGKLEKADPKGFAVDRVTQSTVSSGPSPSPQPQSQFQPRLLGEHGMLPPGRRSMSLGAESIVGGGGGGGGSQRSVVSVITISSGSFESAATQRWAVGGTVNTAPLATSLDKEPSAMGTEGKVEGAGGSQESLKRKQSSQEDSLTDIYESTPPAAKRRATPRSSPREQSPKTQREPLAEVTHNASQNCTNSFHNTSFTTLLDQNISPKSAQKAPNATSPPAAPSPTRRRRRRTPETAAAAPSSPQPAAKTTIKPEVIEIPDSEDEDAAAADTPQQQQRATCKHRGPHCWFAGRTVLLGPRLWRRKVITDKLLRRHGIEGYITDYEAWMPAAPERRPAGRKICLVEAGRREETRAFLNGLEGRPLTLAGGGREYVEVYDWRVLEDVATLEEEQGQKTRPVNGTGVRQDPWKKWWVGLV